MSWSRQKSTVKRPGSPFGQNLGNLGRPDPVQAKIHRKLKKLSGLAPRKIGILGSALYRDIQGSWVSLCMWELGAHDREPGHMQSGWGTQMGAWAHGWGPGHA